MSPLSVRIEEDRNLTREEFVVIRWLLEHAARDNSTFVEQLEFAKVVARCGCGCASVDFSINGVRPPVTAGMAMIADFQWHNEKGHLQGAYVFERNGLLAGLDLWSIDGQSTPDAMPPIDKLIPLRVS